MNVNIPPQPPHPIVCGSRTGDEPIYTYMRIVSHIISKYTRTTNESTNYIYMHFLRYFQKASADAVVAGELVVWMVWKLRNFDSSGRRNAAVLRCGEVETTPEARRDCHEISWDLNITGISMDIRQDTEFKLKTQQEPYHWLAICEVTLKTAKHREHGTQSPGPERARSTAPGMVSSNLALLDVGFRLDVAGTVLV